MAILARAPAARIAELLGDPPAYSRLRGPENGLVMVRGRAGGGGAPFNLGEMTVTRCSIRTESGVVGHAYIAGRDDRRAELAAVVDALMQEQPETFETQVIAPLAAEQAARQADRAAKAAATKVQFFAMQTMRT